MKGLAKDIPVSCPNWQNPSKIIDFSWKYDFFRIFKFYEFLFVSENFDMWGYLRLELRKNKFTKKSHGWRQTHGKCIFWVNFRVFDSEHSKNDPKIIKMIRKSHSNKFCYFFSELISGTTGSHKESLDVLESRGEIEIYIIPWFLKFLFFPSHFECTACYMSLEKHQSLIDLLKVMTLVAIPVLI